MKITMEQTESGKEELILRYSEMNEQIAAILALAFGQKETMSGEKQGEKELTIFSVREVYYFESVDATTYAYLKDEVYRVRERLEDMAERYRSLGFVRCSRTMVCNLHKVEHLKSEAGGRILATMKNKEQVLISRKYAGEVRRVLLDGRGNRK